MGRDTPLELANQLTQEYQVYKLWESVGQPGIFVRETARDKNINKYFSATHTKINLADSYEARIEKSEKHIEIFTRDSLSRTGLEMYDMDMARDKALVTRGTFRRNQRDRAPVTGKLILVRNMSLWHFELECFPGGP